MISAGLEVARLKAVFATERRVQITGFLDAKFAASGLASLEQDVEWSFAIREGEEDKLYLSAEWEAIAIERRHEILRAANRRASTDFQYMFDYYPLMSNYHAGINGSANVNLFAKFIASDEYISFVRQITGSTEISSTDGQATRYRAGQYLTYHDDHAIKQRRFAYVLNLTQAWHPDWGGLLQFHDRGNKVVEAWVPQFNCLNLFAVPAGHSVSFVTPFAAAYRYAITGWFLAGEEA